MFCDRLFMLRRSDVFYRFCSETVRPVRGSSSGLLARVTAEIELADPALWFSHARTGRERSLDPRERHIPHAARSDVELIDLALAVACEPHHAVNALNNKMIFVLRP